MGWLFEQHAWRCDVCDEKSEFDPNLHLTTPKSGSWLLCSWDCLRRLADKVQSPVRGSDGEQE